MTILTTVGYGDLHAVNPHEMSFIIVYMAFNMGLSVYLLGNMALLVIRGDNKTQHIDREKYEVQLLLCQMGMAHKRHYVSSSHCCVLIYCLASRYPDPKN